MKTFHIPSVLFPLLAILSAGAALAQPQNHHIAIPDIPGHKTLQCDFHMHTTLSDGTVWPTVRVDEAYREGLAAIALTDHFESRRHIRGLLDDQGPVHDNPSHNPSHNRGYEIAKPLADERGVILIRGAELAPGGMPPGHFNVLFLKDCDALAKGNWARIGVKSGSRPKDWWPHALAEAKRQNAFFVWNHPGWDAQAPEVTRWWPMHTELYDKGYMQGIEVANSGDYYKEAFQWALEKKLTLLGGSDFHGPVQSNIDFARGEHRTITLVFAKERTAEAIREALDNRRTAVFNKQSLIGEDKWLRAIFESSIEMDIKRAPGRATLRIKNNSGLLFRLAKTAHDERVVYFREYEIKPHSLHTISVKVPDDLADAEVNFEITNLLASPDKGLDYTVKIPKAPAPAAGN